jgi:hypothetical protein
VGSSYVDGVDDHSLPEHLSLSQPVALSFALLYAYITKVLLEEPVSLAVAQKINNKGPGRCVDVRMDKWSSQIHGQLSLLKSQLWNFESLACALADLGHVIAVYNTTPPVPWIPWIDLMIDFLLQPTRYVQ